MLGVPCPHRTAGSGGQTILNSAQCRPFSPSRPTAAPKLHRPLSVTVHCVAEAIKPPTQTFSSISSEAQFFASLSTVVSSGKAPEKLLHGVKILFTNYKDAVLGSDVEGADETVVAQVMASIADRVLTDIQTPYTFPSLHRRILEPYNYYNFGQQYVRWLINFKQSVLGNLNNFSQMQQQLDAGENVIILANHQTEADPGVWALLLEATHPKLATDVFYVAGDRVVADPLCKPFSMGRNLFCVHSRKHMDDQPELKEGKQRTNRKTLSEMARALNQGGQLIWIAPSGGRDRPKSGRWTPDPFDPSAVELMRQLGAKAKPACHFYPVAMHTGEMMPPPTATESTLGEERVTKHVPVGMSAGDELDVKQIQESSSDVKQQQAAFARAAYEAVCEEYTRIEEAISDPYSGSHNGFEQRWLA